MKTTRSYQNADSLLRIGMCFAAVLLLGITGYGQPGGRGGAAVDRSRTRDLSDSERALSSLESTNKRTKRDAQTIMAEVNEDFARLRALNDELKSAVASSTELNYKAISGNATEIKQRGTRLKTNLAALPTSEKQEKQPKQNVPLDDAEMRGLLSTTNEVLTAFLTNPIFSDMGSLDNQLAMKARRDLEHVIELSDVVRSGADKLSKRKV
jgi:hypothetical protein